MPKKMKKTQESRYKKSRRTFEAQMQRLTEGKFHSTLPEEEWRWERKEAVPWDELEVHTSSSGTATHSSSTDQLLRIEMDLMEVDSTDTTNTQRIRAATKLIRSLKEKNRDAVDLADYAMKECASYFMKLIDTVNEAERRVNALCAERDELKAQLEDEEKALRRRVRVKMKAMGDDE